MNSTSIDWSPRWAARTTSMKRSAVRELLKLTARPEVISFAGGLPAVEFFPVEEAAQAAQRVLRNQGGSSLQYGETEGIAPLREWLARQFATDSTPVKASNVLIVSGSQQALDLIGRVLLNEGDPVLVENPTYLAALLAWRPWGVQFVPAASDEGGLIIDRLAKQFQHRPKLLYLVPNFQNPQGTSLCAERREPLARLARQHAVALVEDNPYGELRFGRPSGPHLLHCDARESAGGRLDSNVIYTGTFSKVLVPGLRVAWVIAGEEIIDKLVQAKQAADLHTSTFNQWLVYELVREGFLEAHLPRLREAYRQRRDAMLQALESHFPKEVRWTRPEGGMFLMVTLPPELKAAELLRRAMSENVAFVPGTEFFVDGTGWNTMRLNFSYAPPERIEEGIKRLGQIIARMPVKPGLISPQHA